MRAEFRLLPIRSPVAAGKLKGVRLTTQGRRTGCHLITAADVAGLNEVGPLVTDEPVFPTSELRYRGQILALLAVPYERFPEPDDCVWIDVESTEPYATLSDVERAESSALHTLSVSEIGDRDNTQDALSSAAVVCSGSYEFPGIRHDYLEPDWVRSTFDGDCVTVTTPTQAPFELRALLSGVLALPPEAIIIHGTPPGGAFGGRLQPLLAAQAAVAAHALSSSVLYEIDHTDQRLYGPHSNTLRGRLTLGADIDGRLVALCLTVDVDAGAYSSYGPGVVKRIAVHAAGAYRIDHVYARIRLVWTNSPPAAAFRGFGIGPLTVMLEDQVRMVARRLALDEFELRLRNAAVRGGRLANGQIVDFALGTRECLGLAADARTRMANCDRGNRLRGTGTALFLYGIGNTGQANPAVVELRHVAGSRFLLLTSTVDMGQGSHQALRRLCARLLDVPVDDIAISSGPTSAVPDSGKTSASRTTHFVGEAVRDACDHLIVSALAAARDVLSWQRATWHRGRVRSEPGDGHTAKEATLDQLSELRASGSFTAVGRYAPDLSAAVARYYPVYAVGIVVASITLDAETGYIGVDQVFAAHDVGELLDEDRADGQVVGGVAMGLSLALIDQAVPGPAILAAPDVPPVEVRFVAEPVSGQLVKGLGEPSVLGVGAAVHAAYRSIIERHPAAAKWRPHPVQRWLRSQPTDDTWTGDRENSTCSRDRNPCV